MQVALFVTCLVDNIKPSVGFATVQLLEAAGCDVVVPPLQTCCGQPNYNGGDPQGAAKTARLVIDEFLKYEYVVIPSGSCGGMLKHHYPNLLKDDPDYAIKAQDLAARVYELSQFLTQVAKPEFNAPLGLEVTYHDACAGLRELGIKQGPRDLLVEAGATITELKTPETCCGFGGTFCVKYPEVSSHMVADKVQDAEASGAPVLAAGDLGCLMNIDGKAQRQQKSLEIRHFAELLAKALGSKKPALANDEQLGTGS